MTRAEAIRQLQTVAADVRAAGATALYLFGSTARDQAHAASDLDILVEHERGHSFSIVDLAHVKNLIEDRLGAPVDVTTRESLHPALRREIEASALRVF